MSLKVKIMILLCLFLPFSINAKQVLHFNIAYLQNSMSNYSEKDLKITMSIWIKSITKEIGYDTKMFFYKDPKKAAKDFYAGKIDFITGFPIDFVEYFDTSKLQDGFSGGYKDKKKNQFVVLIKKKNKKQSVEELKNVRVGIQKNDVIMHFYTKLKMRNVKIMNYNRRSTIILDLFFSKLDVAIVPLHSFELAQELNPQIKEQIKILQLTKYISNGVGFYRRGFPTKEKENIYKEAKKIFSTNRGKQMMLIYKMETVIKTPVSSLKNAQELYNTYLQQEKKEKK